MQTEGEKRRLGPLLVRQGVIDPDTMKRAVQVQARDPKRKFRDILVQDLGVDHHAVYGVLAELYAFREYDFREHKLGQEDSAFIRKTLADLPEDVRERVLQKRLVPVKALDADRLAVVTPDPTDPDVMNIVPHFGYRCPEVYYGRLDVVEGLIQRLCPPKNHFLDNMREAGAPLEIEEKSEDEVDEDALDAEIHKSMLTNLIEGCLVEAVRRGASDIHVVPREGSRTDFHFRIDGKLERWYVQEGTRPEAVLAVVKDRAGGVDRFDRDRAQDGFIQRQVDGCLIRFRVSILPVAASRPGLKLESVVIRVLDDRRVITDLQQLGLQTAALQAFEAAIRRPQGMVILTGPTGSGKSTTLNAALHAVMSPSVNVVTVEDPVEYVIPGARQIRIGVRLRFEDAVRSILRHDPDIVMVGEIRDLETAETAVKLANTGHLTFSTLHTNDAPSVLSRLYKMGVEPFLIANAINLVVAQRLVRTLCAKCRQPVAKEAVDAGALIAAGMAPAQVETGTFCRPAGCQACHDTGYKGRAGIHEALLFDREIRRLIIDAGDMVDEDAIRKTARVNGMVTLRQSGLARIAAGETTLEEVLHETAADEEL